MAGQWLTEQLIDYRGPISFFDYMDSNHNVYNLPHNRNIWWSKNLANRLNLPVGENLNWRLIIRLWSNHVSLMRRRTRRIIVRDSVCGRSAGMWTRKSGESGNPNDPDAVAIKRAAPIVVGHVPRKSFAACSVFLLLGGDYLLWNPRWNHSGQSRYSSVLK